MSAIHESLTVLCPFDQVAKAAEAYVDSLPEKDGKSVVALRVSMGDVVVEREADLSLAHSHAYPGFEIMNISWRAHDGGVYPVFCGTLNVEEVTGLFCRLDLDGDYTPPLGIAGIVFDAVVGHRIAVAAARALLDEIKTGIEFAYQTGLTVA